MATDPMILWDKKPEIRKRWKEILSHPEDPLHLLAVADYLASSAAINQAIRQIGQEVLVRQWKKIKVKMEGRGATAHRVMYWDAVVSKLAKKMPAPPDKPSPGKIADHAEIDPVLALFGREIREKRKNAGTTVEQLAKSVETTSAIISRLERGLYNPSLRFLVRLSNVLGPDSIPILFPRVKLPVRIEAMESGELVMTNGTEAISLGTFTDHFAHASCGTAMFGHRFYIGLQHQKKWPELFDVFCESIKASGATLSDAFRIWFYQYHSLRGQTVKEEYLQELIFKAANGWIAALSGRQGYDVADVIGAWQEILNNADAEPMHAQLERFAKSTPPDQKFADETSAYTHLRSYRISNSWLKQVRDAAVTPAEWTAAVECASHLLKSAADGRIRIEE